MRTNKTILLTSVIVSALIVNSSFAMDIDLDRWDITPWRDNANYSLDDLFNDLTNTVDDTYKNTKQEHDILNKAYSKYDANLRRLLSYADGKLLPSTRLNMRMYLNLKKYVMTKNYINEVKVPNVDNKKDEIMKMEANIKKLRNLLLVDYNITQLVKLNNLAIQNYGRVLGLNTLMNIDNKITSLALNLARKDLFNVQIPVYNKIINKVKSYLPRYRNNPKITAILNFIITELEDYKQKAAFLTKYVQDPRWYIAEMYKQLVKTSSSSAWESIISQIISQTTGEIDQNDPDLLNMIR